MLKKIAAMKNFIEELKWRGMIHDVMPGTEEQLLKEQTTAYVGIDPTADSLHIGHLVSIMMLTHIAAHQVTNLCKSSTSIFSNSDLCTTNFCFVKG